MHTCTEQVVHQGFSLCFSSALPCNVPCGLYSHSTETRPLGQVLPMFSLSIPQHCRQITSILFDRNVETRRELLSPESIADFCYIFRGCIQIFLEEEI